MTTPEHAHGYALLRENKAQEAVQWFQGRIERARGDAWAYAGFGAACIQLGREREAWDALTTACRLSDRVTPAFVDLAGLALKQGRFDMAASLTEHALKLIPDDAGLWLRLGVSRARAGDTGGARTALQKSLQLAPHDAEPAAALVALLVQGGAGATELVPALQRLIALKPDALDARLGLVRALMAEKRYAEAKAEIAQILARDPHCLAARWLDFQRPDAAILDAAGGTAYLANWRAGMTYFEGLDWNDARVARQADAVLAGSTNYHLPYLGLPLLAEQRRNAAMLRRLTLAAAPGVVEVAPQPIGRKRRKIAVFSPSLGHANSVGRMWSPTLQRLDAREFELAVFSPEPRDVAEAPAWREAGAGFTAAARPAGAWIDAIRAFAPDILLFPDIGMHQIVQALASLRLAPVQATTWGHPVTSGMSTIDYFLSADAFEPGDGAAHYTETLVRLPRLGVWLDPLPEPTPRARDRDGTIVFLCTQSADKLHAAHDDLFARVLAALPSSRLEILSGATEANAAALAERMRPAFAAHALDFDARCRVLPRLSLDAFRAHLARADVCLDSLDFSGCVSSLDCLWHDLPIVTLPGALARGRQTGAMLRQIGVPELIVDSEHGYVQLAAQLGAEASLRAQFAQRIQAGKNALFCDAGAVDALADFLRTVEHPSLAGS